MGEGARRSRYGARRSSWTIVLALATALGVGGALMWTMRSAFQVGEDMVRSVDESKPIGGRRRAPRDESATWVRATTSVETAKAELREGERVVGRVVIPEGTPQDEVVEVLAYHGSPMPRARVRVGTDGRFELPFPEHAKSMAVALDARYLFLDVDVRFLRHETPAELVLEPELGAWIVGRASVPVGRVDLARSFVGEPIGVACDFDAHAERCPNFAKALARRRSVAPRNGVSASSHPIRARSTKLDETLAFELRGVLPSDAHELALDRERFEPIASFAAKAGAKVELAITVRAVPSLAGRVVDDRDRPVADAECRIVLDDGPSDPIATLVTRLDGAFHVLLPREELDAGAKGLLELRVRHPGFQPFAVKLDRIEQAEWRNGVVVRLKRELAIRGTVVWPDGRAASEAAVSVDPIDASPTREPAAGEGAVVRCDEDGRFEITPLGDGPYRVRARATETIDTSDADEIGRYETQSGVALAPSVPGGTDDLVLRLGAGRVLHGRVHDSDGAPIGSFGVQARPVLGGTASWLPAHEVGDTFQDGEGRFTLEGLQDGEWEVQASYQGFRSAPQRVRVSGSENAVDLVLDKVPTITGRVVDANGAAVEGANVELVAVPPPGAGAAEHATRTRARTDADGRFAFDHVDPGRVRVEARRYARHGFSRSELLELDVVADRRIDELTLRLVAR